MRKTKIICTLGPSTQDDEVLKKLMLSGMNVARVNFSHGNHAQHRKTFDRVKMMRNDLDLPVAMLLDTKGPEIRVGDFKSGSEELEPGQKFVFTTREIEGTKEIVSITYKELPKDVKEGMRILIDDGLIELTIDEVTEDEIRCTVENGGRVSNHKGVNVPNCKLSIPFISESDKADILFGIEQNVEYIAASFTRSAEDIRELKELLNSSGGESIKIIAKIENMEGVENIDEIIEQSDGIMVARGDMGVEIPLEDVPVMQKVIIKKCVDAGKIVITATQMLDSMIKHPRPTRAEATDVANAIYDGTSAIMLSGETAAGEYPIEALETMVKIAERAETDINYRNRFNQSRDFAKPDITTAISHATCTTAIDLKAKAIVTVTASGRTALMISKYRPECFVFGCTSNSKVWHQMSLMWGVIPLVIPQYETTRDLLNAAVATCGKTQYVEKGDIVVVTAGVPVGRTGTTNLLKVQQVGDYQTL